MDSAPTGAVRIRRGRAHDELSDNLPVDKELPLQAGKDENHGLDGLFFFFFVDAALLERVAVISIRARFKKSLQSRLRSKQDKTPENTNKTQTKPEPATSRRA